MLTHVRFSIYQIYSSELQLNESNYFDTEAPCLRFGLSIKLAFLHIKVIINWDILVVK